MAKPRDHAAEYQRAKQLAVERGYRSQREQKSSRRAGRPAARDPYVKGRRQAVTRAGSVTVATTGPRGGTGAVKALDQAAGRRGEPVTAVVTFGTRSGVRTVTVTVPGGEGVDAIVAGAMASLAGKSPSFDGAELDLVDITATVGA